MASCSIARDAPIYNAVTAAVPSGYSIRAKGTEAEIFLYGDVGDSWFGGVTAKQFADDLKAVGKVDTISLHINSAGGSVFDGLAIYRLLVDHKARVLVHVDGIAASIASVIAMAGDEIHASESGFLMVHNAWGMALGNSSDMREMADLLDKTTGSIRDIYVARTGQGSDQIKSWMDEETWFSAQEAMDARLVTHIAGNMTLAARIDPAKHGFRHTPAVLAATPNLDAARERLSIMKLKIDRACAA